VLLEQQNTDGAGNPHEAEVAFTNEDGTPASWLEEISEQDRRRAFAWRAGMGLVIAGLWTLEYSNGLPQWMHACFVIVPVVCVAIGLAFAWRAYRQTSIGRFSTVRMSFTRTERIKRALILGYVAAAISGLLWWTQPEDARFAHDWRAALPALLIVLTGFAVYRLKGGVELTAAATKAKEHLHGLKEQARLERQQVRFERQARRSAAVEAFFKKPLVRYPIASLLLCGAYYFATSDVSNGGWLSAAAIALAAYFAHEMSRWLVFAACLGVGVWTLFTARFTLTAGDALIIWLLLSSGASKKDAIR
jgi:hypothetical protein